MVFFQSIIWVETACLQCVLKSRADSIYNLKLYYTGPFGWDGSNYRPNVGFHYVTKIHQYALDLAVHVGRRIDDRTQGLLWLLFSSFGVTLNHGSPMSSFALVAVWTANSCSTIYKTTSLAIVEAVSGNTDSYSRELGPISGVAQCITHWRSVNATVRSDPRTTSRAADVCGEFLWIVTNGITWIDTYLSCQPVFALRD